MVASFIVPKASLQKTSFYLRQLMMRVDCDSNSSLVALTEETGCYGKSVCVLVNMMKSVCDRMRARGLDLLDSVHS